MKSHEYNECKAFWEWICWKKLNNHIIHIPNEGQRSPYQGKRLKDIGLRAGASDYIIGIARGEWHGMCLEMKVGKNKPTLLQEQFMIDWSEEGYYCVWVVGFDGAREALEAYLAL